ncbi:MAG: zinc metalloprotease HtpX [Ignisphaera sp.]|uniref:Protease HtpX homolog n=1 Tax=Ignisphaera aggregans TaxID=334771 RepID=A0A7J3JSB7_9CREN
MMRSKILIVLSLIAIALVTLTIIQLLLSVLLPGLGREAGLFPFFWNWWLIDIAAYTLAMVTLITAGISFEKIIRSRVPAGLDHLRSSMFSAAAAIIAATILIILLIGSIISPSMLLYMGILAVLFAIVPSSISWLTSPAIINFSYRCKHDPELQKIVDVVSKRAGIEPPKAMISELPIPNAFAYSSPIMGRYVAVTSGLLKSVRSREELEAIIGHELGHHKHRDNAIIMIFGLFPSVIYFLGRFMMFAGMMSSYIDGSNRRREGSGGLILFIIGIILIVVSILLQLAVLALSRLREYYADAHGAKVTSPYAMIGALESLDRFYRSYGVRRWIEDSKIKTLFIYALSEPFIGLEEVLSTHPPIYKRISFLKTLIGNLIEA